MPTVVHLVNPQPDIDACIFGYVYEDANANGVLDGPDVQTGSYDVQILRNTGGILENWQCYVGPDLFNFSYVPLNENLRAQFTIVGDWFFSTPNTNPACNLDPWLTRYDALETYESLEVNGQSVVRGTSEDIGFQTVTGVVLPIDDAHTFDIGIYRKASFSDHLYHDVNQNGVQDAGEAGLAGVQVSLVGVDGYGQAVERSTITDAQGVYQFSDLMPATYQLLFHVPGWTVTESDLLTNWSSESDCIRIEMPVLLSGDVKANGGTGLTAYTRIEGWVWYDDNHDGLQNDDLFHLGESGVVWLYQQGVTPQQDVAVASTTLEANGAYVFANLPLGTYYVDFSEVEALPGTQWTTPHVDPQQHELDSDVNAASRTGTLVLSVATPALLNQDAGIYVPAPTVTLSTQSEFWHEEGEHCTLTVEVNLSNPQLHDVVLPLSYSGAVDQGSDIETAPVQVQIPAGATSVTFDLAARSDNLYEGSEVLEITGGGTTFTMSLLDDTNPFDSSRVFADDNGNGVQDVGEMNLAGVTIELLDANANVVNSAVSETDGSIRFADAISPGEHTLHFSLPAWAFGPRGQAAPGEIGSDVDPATGKSDAFTLALGQSQIAIHAGVDAYGMYLHALQLAQQEYAEDLLAARTQRQAAIDAVANPAFADTLAAYGTYQANVSPLTTNLQSALTAAANFVWTAAQQADLQFGQDYPAVKAAFDAALAAYTNAWMAAEVARVDFNNALIYADAVYDASVLPYEAARDLAYADHLADPENTALFDAYEAAEEALTGAACTAHGVRQPYQQTALASYESAQAALEEHSLEAAYDQYTEDLAQLDADWVAIVDPQLNLYYSLRSTLRTTWTNSEAMAWSTCLNLADAKFLAAVQAYDEADDVFTTDADNYLEDWQAAEQAAWTPYVSLTQSLALTLGPRLLEPEAVEVSPLVVSFADVGARATLLFHEPLDTLPAPPTLEALDPSTPNGPPSSLDDVDEEAEIDWEDAWAEITLIEEGSRLLGRVVWHDAAGAQQPASADLTVLLFSNVDGEVLQTTTTDADGLFEFTGVTAGDYRVEVDGLSELVETSDENPEDAEDPDENVSEDVSPKFTMTGTAMAGNASDPAPGTTHRFAKYFLTNETNSPAPTPQSIDYYLLLDGRRLSRNIPTRPTWPSSMFSNYSTRLEEFEAETNVTLNGFTETQILELANSDGWGYVTREDYHLDAQGHHITRTINTPDLARQMVETRALEIIRRQILSDQRAFDRALRQVQHDIRNGPAEWDTDALGRQARLASAISALGPRPETPRIGSLWDYVPIVGSVLEARWQFENGNNAMGWAYLTMGAIDAVTLPSNVTSIVSIAGRTAVTFTRTMTSIRTLVNNGRSAILSQGFRPAVTLAIGNAARRTYLSVDDALRVISNSSCFAADTPLLTSNGEKYIQDFREGDKILSRSEFDPNGPLEVQTVEKIFVRQAALVELRVGGRSIRTTAEHPFFVRNKGWICIKEIQAGDELSSHDGQWIAVADVIDSGEMTTVYNLRVSESHTYFVGSRSWNFSVWAHNANYEWWLQEGKMMLRNRQSGHVVESIWQTERDLLRWAEREGVQLQQFERRGIAAGAAGSPEHKTFAWAEYRSRGGEWSFNRWSNVYDANMVRARNANAIADAYHATLGWGQRERTVQVSDGVVRILDIADIPTRRGVEVKSGYICLTEEIRSEIARDATLRLNNWDIRWHFEGTASQPLRDELTRLGIPFTGGV